MPFPFVPSGHFPTLWGITLLAELSQLDRSCLRLAFYSQSHNRQMPSADAISTKGVCSILKWEVIKSIGFINLVIIPKQGQNNGQISIQCPNLVNKCLLVNGVLHLNTVHQFKQRTKIGRLYSPKLSASRILV